MGGGSSKPDLVKDLWSGSEGEFESSHGDAIGFRTWTPAGEVRGTVFIVHGLHEHSGRYSRVAEYLNGKGYAVYANDHAGHGLSAGDNMGFVSDYRHMSDAVAEFVKTMLDGQPLERPVYMLCHSMGAMVGAVALAKLKAEDAALYGRIKGVAFTGCALSPGPGSASPLGLTCCFCLTKSKGLLHCLVACFATADPHGPNAPIDDACLSHDPEVAARLKKDFYHFRGRIKNKTAHEVVKLSDKTREVLPTLTLPCLLMHGGDDTICYPDGSEEMLSLLGSSKKTLKVVPGLFHEILNEPNSEVLLDDITEFYSTCQAVELENVSLEM
ncbi:putative lysophospholipase [Tribonema minus]|uniref:Putative lysophospholipase n=1 Tax=Tribonema minus TaxID=303371 RepID=A0A836C8A9_9STRA|nr:putative lysophospholipase [Tribonema minus]